MGKSCTAWRCCLQDWQLTMPNSHEKSKNQRKASNHIVVDNQWTALPINNKWPPPSLTSGWSHDGRRQPWCELGMAGFAWLLTIWENAAWLLLLVHLVCQTSHLFSWYSCSTSLLQEATTWWSTAKTRRWTIWSHCGWRFERNGQGLLYLFGPFLSIRTFDFDFGSGLWEQSCGPTLAEVCQNGVSHESEKVGLWVPIQRISTTQI